MIIVPYNFSKKFQFLVDENLSTTATLDANNIIY